VWWLGQKRSAALNGGATGGMSADILLAHSIAAAKVRRQSLQFLQSLVPGPADCTISAFPVGDAIA